MEIKSDSIYYSTLVAILSLFLWNTPIIFPIKFFVILLHEINHALIAVITGGSVNKIVIDINLSGFTVIKGGNQFLIAISGYVGSLIWGTVLILRKKYTLLNFITFRLLPAIILIMGIKYIESGYYTFFALLSSLLLFLISTIKYDQLKNIILQSVGLISCLYVITDIKDDLITTSLRETDAQIIEYITGVNSVFVGFSVLLISLILVVFVIRIYFKSKT